MKTIREFNYAAVWLATKLYLFAVGVGALIVWFCEPMGWLLRTGSIVTAVCTWLLIFKLTLGYFERQRNNGQKKDGEGASDGVDVQGENHQLRRRKSGRFETCVVRSENRSEVAGASSTSYRNPAAEDASLALINLEYPPRVARRAVRNAVRAGAQDFESIFRSAQAQLRT